MRKLGRLLIVTALSLAMVACTPIEQQARNTAAALQGAIVAVQAQYQATCTPNPSQASCVSINKGVAAQNLLITATEAYCGWSTSAPPSNPMVTCVPVKGAQAALQTAILNANAVITELKGLV